MSAAHSLTVCNVYTGARGCGFLHGGDGIGFLRHVESTGMRWRWLQALKTFWCVWNAVAGLNFTGVQRHTVLAPRMSGIWRRVLFFWMLCAVQTSRGQVVWGLTVIATNSFFIRGKWYGDTVHNQDVWIPAFIWLIAEYGKKYVFIYLFIFINYLTGIMGSQIELPQS